MLEREHDRCTYWFYYFRLDLTRFKCDRNQFAKALVAEGVGASAGYIRTPVYEYPMFQKHSFFNGSWPLRDMGLTKMDYRRVSCPESVEILKTGIRFRITEDMDGTYVHQIAAAIRKVATHYAV
jgi:dTDP-4-amino-4,6-dideoxygalactose transaminase